MKNKLTHFLFFALALLIHVTGFSQDIIVLKTGDEILSKVEEIGIETIKYKKFDNVTGPSYTILKSSVFMIKYENGTKDVFNTSPEPTQTYQPNTQQQPTNNPSQTVSKSNSSLPPMEYFSKGKVKIDGSILSPFEVKDKMKDYPAAYNLYNDGRSMKIVGDVFDGIFWAFFGFATIAGINGDADAMNRLAMIGLSWEIPAIVFKAIGRNKIKQSVGLYNSSINKPTSFNYGFSPNGFGLVFKF